MFREIKKRPGDWLCLALLIYAVYPALSWKIGVSAFLIGWALNLAVAKWRGDL